MTTPTLQIYLSFDGDCEAAFRFYEERLGATPGKLFRYADSPMANEVPPDWQTKVMHASITLFGMTLNGADPPLGRFVAPQGFQIFLEVDDPAETERLYDALAENATIEMPLQQTFWSLRFGGGDGSIRDSVDGQLLAGAGGGGVMSPYSWKRPTYAALPTMTSFMASRSWARVASAGRSSVLLSA